MITRLISLIIRGAVSASTDTKPIMKYETGLTRYDKAYFDDEFPFQFYKWPLKEMPDNIEYYQANIGHITLMKKNDTKQFEIYETKVISDKELAMNVRISYPDFAMTGISSRKNTVVNKNDFFVLVINNKMDQIQIRSSIQSNITEKMIKADFGEYLIKYLKNNMTTANGMSTT